jgi:Rieske Fe-S protein
MGDSTRLAMDPTRRRLLAGLVTAAGAGLVQLPSSGCRPPAEEPPAPFTAVPKAEPVEVPLERLAEGRVTVLYGAVPVEVRTTDAGGVEARALLCTHQGCRVVWQPARQTYDCACHEGRFDASGRPVAGMPALPLMRVPARRSAAAVTVGES